MWNYLKKFPIEMIILPHLLTYLNKIANVFLLSFRSGSIRLF